MVVNHLKGLGQLDEVQQGPPPIGNEFARARDPLIAKQMDDLEKTEAQRRREQFGRPSAMVSKDRPHHTMRPPSDIAHDEDARSFSRQWLREQRDAALDQARVYDEAVQQIKAPERQPDRGREPGR